MRTYNPTDEYDCETAIKLKAEPWQLDLLKLNPAYVHWGPHEDYMWNEGEGWNSRVILSTWPEFKFGLDDYNECVNFYFSVGRESITCRVCGGDGYHPDAHWITESFYSHSSPFKAPLGHGVSPEESLLQKYGAGFREFCAEMQVHHSWADRITEDEAAKLIEAGRGYKGSNSAHDFNEAQKQGGMAGHDAINRSILVRQRCERLGVPVLCETCDGDGSVFTADHSHVSLTLWILHPRKGCSRGVEITKLSQSDLPAVFSYLREAADRNTGRFSAVPVANGAPAERLPPETT